LCLLLETHLPVVRGLSLNQDPRVLISDFNKFFRATPEGQPFDLEHAKDIEQWKKVLNAWTT
jgi:hypothetical protein